MKRLILLMSLLTSVCTLSAAEEQPARPEWAGIWGAWGTYSYNNSWLKGSIISTRWRDVEPQEGEFDFSALDAMIDEAVENDQRFIAKVYMVVPEWIYDGGVPKVYIDFKNGYKSNKSPYQPYYLDDDFKTYLTRMWDAFQQHIGALPEEKLKHFVGFQIPLGRSGDPQAYYDRGPIDKQYEVDSDNKWRDYQVEMAQVFISLLKKNDLYNPSFYPLINFTEGAAAKAYELKIPVNRKSLMVAQAYGCSGEGSPTLMNQRRMINSLYPDGSGYVRCRGEFDEHVRESSSWFLAAPTWHYYWHCNWMLTYGLDMFMQRTKTCDTGDKHKIGFEFFNSHAGYKDVTTAKYAYATLRDGLDVADTDRFSESEYGSIDDMGSRFESVLAQMAPYGARDDSPESHKYDYFWTYMKDIKALNDACQNGWRGNYGRYLEQIEPNVTDQGYWRVGSKDDPYGRYARGFDVANDKNALYFDLDDSFYADSKGEAKSAKLRVIYYSDEAGKWTLQYHATDGTMKQFSVKNKKGKGWQTIEFDVDDALFENGGEKGSDIAIVNLGKTDCIFHLMEIERR